MRAPAVLSCLALASGATLLATPAAADPPLTCGSTVTVSRSLGSDLTCPGPGPALMLTAGVKLDLAGHTLRGPGKGVSVGIGVPVHGNVAIGHGTITGWSAGVQTVGSDDAGSAGVVVVHDVTFDGNTTGLDASGDLGAGRFGKLHKVHASTFTHNARGILAGWFTTVDVTSSSFADNGTSVAVDSSTVTVADSRIERSTRGFELWEATATIRRSTLLENDQAVLLHAMSAVTMADSTVKGSDVAVSGSGYTSVTLTGSTFASNTTAVAFDEGGGSLTGNTFRANGTGFVSTAPGTEATVLRDNVFRLNGDGIRIEAGDAMTSLGGNTSNDNTGWGIYAPGVVDLGGNTARRNGRTPQCVGVVCPVS
ncbi:hypothetical protein Cch01nite_00540 [Cellulomonas chitinilytica]|uniref:Right handed beta helix domain-containing protein n=1 Tax=Cellulomonas chitinilytica TaxID=398759 RepID=A0A919NYF7_9CELL|nr:right-handed parallel beta-helix repeat-containing protein [Cellulomonas chitinilytica]GIG19330.1 hypothetical protein Cch01nite_00540 [Cellulomonas chitinilytica]